MKKLLILTAALLVLVGGVTSVVKTDGTEYQTKDPAFYGGQGNTHTSGFLGQVIVDLNNSTAESSEELQTLLTDAQSVNEDCVGWVSIPELNISYPVLFSGDNSEYLRKDINGEYSVAGSIFLDGNYENQLSPVKLLHGHNMKNGTFFSNVPSLLKLDTLEDAPNIFYYDEYGLKEYQIISVFSIDTEVEDESVIVSEYSSLTDLSELKQSYINRSLVPVETIPDSLETLMINTCWYGESGRERRLHCIVVACRV